MEEKKWPENEVRFVELILYISQKCAHDKKFGAVKLNKTLFYSDFLSYAEFGEPITGFEYQRLRKGPAPRRLLPVRSKMQKQGELGLQEVKLKSGKTQVRTVNLRAPNLSVFKPDHIALVDSVIESLQHADAQTVSDISHRMGGWKGARLGERIPYETVFVSNAPLTEEDIERGLEVAREFDLVL